MQLPCNIRVELPIVNIRVNTTVMDMILFMDLYVSLKKYKDCIDDIDNKKWDKIKKNNNPYELLHISSNKYHQSIPRYRPISRSYFKLIELACIFNLFLDKPMICAFVSEGPGGFIESVLNNRRTINDKLYGITLNTYNKHVPSWKRLTDLLNRQIVNKKSNVMLSYGNIYLMNDIRNFCCMFNGAKADLITSDGGFDYSINFNNQEQLSYRIILSEILIALTIQKEGGNFICKCFDLLTVLSLKLVYLLYCFYDEVHIYKPSTSRPANSEKYIIAKGFRGIDINYLNELYTLLELWNDYEVDDNIIVDIFDIELPCEFIDIMYKYNTESINNQINYITNTIKMVHNKPEKDIYIDIIKNQTDKALGWCNRYNVCINENSKYVRKYLVNT
jgi:23S rRNA U2552 (ribose-2'-O)-methylase RlmE/FtsJ